MNVDALSVEVRHVERAGRESNEWVVLTQGACGWLLVGQLGMDHGWNLSNGLNFWGIGIHSTFVEKKENHHRHVISVVRDAVLLERFEDFHVVHVGGEVARCEQTFN